MKKENPMPNFIEMEEDILKFWQNEKIFDKVVEKNKNTNKRFRFLDGPITANNPMGIHHAWNRSLKDIIHRYKAMTGHSAQYQNGFDAQGLWVEVEVEKELGLKDKTDIEKIGLETFTKACIARVDKYSKIITEQSIRLGQWMDWQHSYFTNSDENIKSIWYFLKKCEEKKWLVQKHRPMPWCPHCGTSLSEHELADSYSDMEHTAVFFILPIKNSNESILVWTTTPWTLSANVAVAVNADMKYSVCEVKSTNRKIIVASSLLKVLKGDLIKVQKEVLGKELVGLEYETCFPFLSEQNFVHKIVAWDMVLSEEGSGAVHIAPGCGVEDFELGEKLNLEKIIPVDEEGVFYSNFDFLSGKNTTEVANIIFDKLKTENKLYYTHKYTHRYPICWRCKTPLIYRLTKEWYIKVDEIRPQLIKACEDVIWQPEFLKKRMLDWLVNMGDWNISRKRFYGLPLPFYVCDKCQTRTVVGSIEELQKLSSKEEVEKLPHLHRPYIDDIEITCPHCHSKVKRVSEVGDCWLDAGITPFSTKKYFTDRKYWQENFPQEVVVEMKEQIRLWFYAMLFMSVTLEQKAPYEKVIGFSMLVNESGAKFSKSGKNNIKFFDAANQMGADVIRYMFASNNMLNDTRFGFSIGDEIRRKLLGLWNAYIFFNTYAILDKPDLSGFDAKNAQFDKTDVWLLSRINEFVKIARENYEKHQFYIVVKEFEVIVDDLTNWYIRINRKRFWKSVNSEDKLSAYYTLYTSLKTITQVIAPITPFMSEHIWNNMVVCGFEKDAPQSVFLQSFPEVQEEYINEKITNQTKVLRDTIALAQRLRNESQIKIKQPLKNLYVTCDKEKQIAIQEFEDVLKDELNIKEVIYVDDLNKFNDSFLSINFKEAGSVLKGDVQKLRQKLLSLSSEEMEKLVVEYKIGKINFAEFGFLDSNLFNLMTKPKKDFIIASENNITLVLDTTIDQHLMIEGLYRELVRQIQVLRKEAQFKIQDRIIVNFETESDSLLLAIKEFGKKIQTEALIKEISAQIDFEKIENCIIGGEEIKISMKRVKNEN